MENAIKLALGYLRAAQISNERGARIKIEQAIKVLTEAPVEAQVGCDRCKQMFPASAIEVNDGGDHLCAECDDAIAAEWTAGDGGRRWERQQMGVTF